MGSGVTGNIRDHRTLRFYKYYSGVAQVGGATDFESEGCRFEACLPIQNLRKTFMKKKTRKKRGIIWHLEKEQLQDVIKNSQNMSEVLRKLNIFTIGANRTTLLRRISVDNIDISHFPKGSDSNKGRKFPTRLNKLEILSEKLFVENSLHGRNTVRRRILKEKIIPYVCAECGSLPQWKNKTLTLVLDHINGTPNDNRLENLRFLCPNCNSQTNTFAGRNSKKNVW